MVELHFLRGLAIRSRLARLVYQGTLPSYISWRLDHGPKGNFSGHPGAPVPVGLIGAGKHARKILIPSLERIPELNLVLLCSRSKSTAKTLEDRFDIPVTTNFREVLRRKDIAAIIISTPSSLHSPLASSALTAGKFVFCEAPGLTVDHDYRLLSSLPAQTLNRLLFGYHFCFCPIYVELKRHLDLEPGPIIDMSLRFPASFHLYSLAIHLAGPLKSIRCLKKRGEFERVFSGTFRNGGAVSFEVSGDRESKDRIELVTVRTPSHIYQVVDGRTLLKDNQEILSVEFPASEESDMRTLEHRGFIPELHHFAKIVAGDQDQPLTGLEFVRNSYLLNLALFSSLNSRKEILI